MTSRWTANRAEIAEEAAGWFVRLRDGAPARELRQAFSNWLLESPVHVYEYLATSRLFAELERIDPVGEIDLDALAPESGPGANVVTLDTKVAKYAAPVRSRRWLLGVAASVAAVAITLAAALWPDHAANRETYSTRLGEQRSIVLDDGSIVVLNTLTEIHVLHGADNRRVKLIEGEALFDVERDARRPFIVDTGGATVRVLGTRFNVYKAKDTTEVTVLDGKVTIERPSDADDPGGDVVVANDRQVAMVELSVGERARIAPEQAQITRAMVANIAQVTAWTERRLIFDAEPLADIVAQFNRYNVSRLEVEEGDLSNLRLNGAFGSNDPDSFIVFLQRLPNIEVVRRAGGTRVIRTRGAPVHE